MQADEKYLPIIRKEVCKKIADERAKLGVSQEKFSQLLGVSVDSISKQERCQVSPSIDTVARVSKYKGISVPEFFNEINVPTRKVNNKKELQELKNELKGLDQKQLVRLHKIIQYFLKD